MCATLTAGKAASAAFVLVAAHALVPVPAWAQAQDLAICQAGEPQPAADACSRLIAGREVEPGEGGNDLATALIARSTAYFRLRRYEAAAVDAEQAIALLPDDAQPRLLRGNIAYEAKDYAGAIGHYSLAIERDPTLASAYAGRGGARTYESDLENALADFEEALANGLASAWVFNGRGNVHRAAGDLDRAYEDYLRAARLDPEKVDAWLNIGDIRMMRADFEGAREAYQRAVDLDPEDRTDMATGTSGLGEALARLGRSTEAFAAYERGFGYALAEDIAAAQAYLAKKGHFFGRADGVYGAATRAALKACIADPDC